MYFVSANNGSVEKTMESLNKALMLVYLFGNKEQVSKAREIIICIREKQREFPLHSLLLDLMTSLRKELRLEKVEPFTFGLNKNDT